MSLTKTAKIVILASVAGLLFAGSFVHVFSSKKVEKDDQPPIYLSRDRELDRINTALDLAKKWQSDAVLHNMGIYQLSRTEDPYIVFNFFSIKSNGCYDVKIKEMLNLPEAKEVSCDNQKQMAILNTQGLLLGSSEVVSKLNWYARYSKLSELTPESFVNIVLTQDETTGKLTWTATMQTTPEVLSPVVLIDASTGELLKTFVLRESANGKRELDHYD